ncbi:unnamed protein product, partial [Durusdinium trenchii]
AYDEAKAAGKASPAKEVEKLGYRGFYRCCVYKCAKCRQVQHWDLLVTTAPQLAKRMKELPNKVRKMIGQPLKFVSRISGMNLEEKGTTILPPELAEMVAEAVERIALGEECDFYFVADVLKLAIQQWNESVDLKKQKLSSAGGLLQTLEAVTAGEEGFQENEAVARVENSVAEQMGRLQKITLKPTENNFLKSAQRLCQKCGIGVCGNTKPGKHLPSSHPALQKLREFIQLFGACSTNRHGGPSSLEPIATT